MKLKNGIKTNKIKRNSIYKDNSLINPVALAKDFHDFYEKNAKKNRWETQKDCKGKEFHELPKRNLDTMVHTAANIMTKYWVIPKEK